MNFSSSHAFTPSCVGEAKLLMGVNDESLELGATYGMGKGELNGKVKISSSELALKSSYHHRSSAQHSSSISIREYCVMKKPVTHNCLLYCHCC